MSRDIGNCILADTKIASDPPRTATFGDRAYFALNRNCPLPDEAAGCDLLDARHHSTPMKHHRIKQVGDHAGVVRDDEELFADLRAGAGAGRKIDHAVFFREAGDAGF